MRMNFQKKKKKIAVGTEIYPKSEKIYLENANVFKKRKWGLWS